MDDITDEMAFLQERVMATRQVHLMRFTPDGVTPDTAVMMDNAAAGMSLIIVPVMSDTMMHLEMHLFKGGNRTGFDLNTPDTGIVELTVRAAD